MRNNYHEMSVSSVFEKKLLKYPININNEAYQLHVPKLKLILSLNGLCLENEK